MGHGLMGVGSIDTGAFLVFMFFVSVGQENSGYGRETERTHSDCGWMTFVGRLFS